MNAPIIRLYAFFAVLFGVLVFATSWWSVFGPSAARQRLQPPPAARRGADQARHDPRRRRQGARAHVKIDKERYRRTYPTDRLFAHAIGYSFTKLGRSGLEQYRNDELTGRRTELIGAVDSLLGRDVGDDDPHHARAEGPAGGDRRPARAQGRRGRAGAEHRQGAGDGLHARYNPNDLDEGDKFEELATDDANSPLVNRATQAGYPPGSTMKTVTATAALDPGSSRRSRPSAARTARRSRRPAQQLRQRGLREHHAHRRADQLGQHRVGRGRREARQEDDGEYMSKYGFKQPPIDSRATSWPRRARPGGKLLAPTSPRIDVGRMAIGQDKLLVTPLQMACVAATIANGGVRMEPHITQKIVDPDARRTRSRANAPSES